MAIIAGKSFSSQFHPAALLVVWLVYALILQWLAPRSLFFLVLAVAVLAAWVAAERSLGMLKRSRWLLITVGAIYLLATPGVYLPGAAGNLGLSFEGVEQGFVQIARIVALLLSLAILHELMSTQGMLKSLHCLLHRFSWGEATVVRLMLVLDYIEGKSQIAWREWLKPAEETCGAADRFVLVQTPFRRIDVFMVLGACSVLAWVVVRA